MTGITPHSLFESPSFLQKLLKRKPESKYAIRPLYTADIITEERPWRKQIQAAKKAATTYTFQPICQKRITKTYNMQQQSSPITTPSASLLTNDSSLSDSVVITPEHFSSIPLSHQRQRSPPPSPRRKRPLSSEFLLRLMDQQLMKQQQFEQQKIAHALLSTKKTTPTITKSLSTSTSSSASGQSRLNKLISQNKPLLTPSISMSLPSRRNSQQSQKRQKSNKSSLLQNKRSFPSSNSNSSSSSSSSYSGHLTSNSSNSIKAAMAAFSAMPYVLSQDNDEQDRLVAQHYLLRTAFGSDFKSPVKSQLQKGIIVLDIGCGPGTWTMEMSTAFPKSTFIGVDQHAYFPKDIKPRNCHFRTCASLAVERQQQQQQLQLNNHSHLQNGGHHDASEEDTHDDCEKLLVLPFPDNSIDYIYQRDMNWALMGQTWQPLLLECLRVLKPGGWIEFVEPDLETQNSLESEYLMNDQLITGLTLRQQDPYAAHRLPTMLAINGFCHVEDFGESLPLGWGFSHSAPASKTNSVVMETNLSSEKNAADQASEKCTKQQKGSTTCSEFARAVSSQYLFFLKSLKPWLSTVMNLGSDEYDNHINSLPEEWKRAKTYINWHTIIAQKPYM